MAKAFDIEGFDVNNNLTDCLHLLFKARTEELFFYYDRLFDNKDIEILHNARVSSRRLLALFKVFRPMFPQKKFVKIYEPLYNFKNILGPVRENDVLLKMIGEYISGFVQQDVKSVMLFFAKLKNDNITARTKLFKNKELIDFKNHKEKLFRFYEKYLLKQKKNVDLLDINLNFKDNAILILPFLFGKVKNFQDKVHNHPRNKTLLHRMRIKAKPLRYTMELYLKAFGEDFKKCYEEIKLFVEKTGDIHDFDIISDYVTNYLKELRIYNDTQKGKKEKISTKSLREYLKFLKDKRTASFNEVCELLNKWETEDFKSSIENSVSYGINSRDTFYSNSSSNI
jgi:CHAD domain-containing protein